MKRIICIFLFAITLYIPSLSAYALDYEQDDHSYLDIRYGYWYSKWLPLQSASAYSYDAYFKNKIEAAMLTDVSTSITFAGKTDFLAQYISDKIMKKVDTGMKQDLSREEKKTTDILMGQIKQRLYYELYITGRYTLGKFRGDMTATHHFDYNGKHYVPGEESSWYTDFSIYDLSINIGRPRYMRPGVHDIPWIGSFGIGIRRTEYSFPMQYGLNYGEFTHDTATAVSHTKFVGYNPCIFVDVEKSLADYGDSRHSLTVGGLLTIGFPKLTNENLNARGMNIMEDFQMAYNFALLKNDYVVFRFYLGFRFMQNGYFTMQKMKMTAKRDVNVYDDSGAITYTVRSGDTVNYGGNFLDDLFVGPVFGFETIF